MDVKDLGNAIQVRAFQHVALTEIDLQFLKNIQRAVKSNSDLDYACDVERKRATNGGGHLRGLARRNDTDSEKILHRLRAFSDPGFESQSLSLRPINRIRAVRLTLQEIPELEVKRREKTKLENAFPQQVSSAAAKHYSGKKPMDNVEGEIVENNTGPISQTEGGETGYVA